MQALLLRPAWSTEVGEMSRPADEVLQSLAPRVGVRAERSGASFSAGKRQSSSKAQGGGAGTPGQALCGRGRPELLATEQQARLEAARPAGRGLRAPHPRAKLAARPLPHAGQDAARHPAGAAPAPAGRPRGGRGGGVPGPAGGGGACSLPPPGRPLAPRRLAADAGFAGGAINSGAGQRRRAVAARRRREPDPDGAPAD